MKPYKIRLSIGDLRAQGMYILLEDGDDLEPIRKALL